MKRNGFTLIEVLVSIGLIAVMMGASAELFRSNYRVVGNTEQLSRQTAQIDAAIVKLRRDVWGAAGINRVNEHAIDLIDPAGAKVSWVLSADGLLLRTDSAGPAGQWTVPNSWSFSADAAGITVSDAESQGETSVRLVSQVLLAGRRAP